MTKRYIVLLVLAVMTVATAVAASKKFTLVIDAGHGGNDAGAIGSLTKEKTINLNVALAFGRLVERNCPDVKVIYTRKSDVFVPLHTRADIANRAKADLFVSIHTNSLPKGRVARGIETYTLGMHRASENLDVAKRENAVILIEDDYKQRYQGFDPNSSESYIMFEFIQDHNMAQSVGLAKSVQKHLCARSGRQDKGVKQAGFLVLRETSMPSCLIELGFISTPDEEKFLHSSSGVERLGRGIYEAFMDYRSTQDKGGRASVAPVAKKEEAVPQASSAPAVQPADEKASKGKKRKKSAMAQELADIREGRSTLGEGDGKPAVVNADSIVASLPDQEEMTPDTAARVKVEPAKPAVDKVEPARQASAPVFKVQILATGSRLKAGDAQLKGQKNADFYQDGGLYKYTVGASTNYNEIYQLRKTLTARFPQAFIIAFKDGQRTDVQEAVREFKERRR